MVDFMFTCRIKVLDDLYLNVERLHDGCLLA